MKKMILALSILTFIGCSKPKEESKFDPNRAYYMKYQTDPQIVKLRVSNDTLRLDFYENINVLVDPTDYLVNTWSLCLIEDYSNCYLKGLHFDALASAAGRAHDWVPINLNDAAPGQKTSTKVNVDGKEYVKITIQRLLEFYSPLGSNQAAINQQNTLLQATNEYVGFKLFYGYGGGYSISNDASIKLVYTN